MEINAKKLGTDMKEEFCHCTFKIIKSTVILENLYSFSMVCLFPVGIGGNVIHSLPDHLQHFTVVPGAPGIRPYINALNRQRSIVLL